MCTVLDRLCHKRRCAPCTRPFPGYVFLLEETFKRGSFGKMGPLPYLMMQYAYNSLSYSVSTRRSSADYTLVPTISWGNKSTRHRTRVSSLFPLISPILKFNIVGWKACDDAIHSTPYSEANWAGCREGLSFDADVESVNILFRAGRCEDSHKCLYEVLRKKYLRHFELLLLPDCTARKFPLGLSPCLDLTPPSGSG